MKRRKKAMSCLRANDCIKFWTVILSIFSKELSPCCISMVSAALLERLKASRLSKTMGWTSRTRSTRVDVLDAK